MSLLIRRGTDSERQTITPLEGEFIYTTDLTEVWIGDGSTVGGNPVGQTTVPSLQDVTDVGNSTTNDIDFGSGVGLLFDNGARVREGTTDAGLGGLGGVALRCSVDYELKWDAGRLFVMQQDGFTIRGVFYNFTFTPTVTDDDTKGFVIGSRWVLDNGDIYTCSDATTGAAVWDLTVNGIPTLQQVTDSGAITTTTITVGDLSNDYSQILPTAIGTENDVSGTYAYLDSTGMLGLHNGTVESNLKNTNVTNSGVILEFPNKTIGNYDIATTDDLIELQTNGSINTDQTLLNLIEGNNITITDDGIGGVTIDAASGIYHGVASGTDTYTTTIAGVTSLSDGDAFIIRFTNGNTNGSTLDINSLGAVSLYRSNDGEIIGGDIADDSEMLCVYNASSPPYFKCIGTSPNSLFAYVTNADSVTINKGQPVYAFGSAGDRMSVKLAYNTTDATSAQTYGLVYSSSIAAGQKGFIIIQGVINGLNLGSYTSGDPIYLGATAGTITKTKPSAPNHLVYLGVVEKANAGNGSIYVRVQNGYELDEIHDVDLITNSPTNGQVLQYVTGSPNLWKNGSIFGQLFIELNGLGGVIQAPSYTGVSNITYNGTITGWTIFSQNPSTGAALSGSVDVDIWIGSAGSVPTVANTIFSGGNNPKLTSASYNSNTSLSIAVTKGQTVMAKVNSATTCVLVNIQLQITRTG